MNVALRHGLPANLRADAARLYWHAFGPKLGRVLGPEPLALRFLMRVMRADQCMVAIGPQGQLLGIAGFRTDANSFAGGTITDLRVVYGDWGAAWRAWVLLRLASAPDIGFLLDGLCVAPTAQGRGIGTQLVDAICQHARSLGHPAINLEVVEGNARAEALYKRCGFAPVQRIPTGLMRWVFGYAATRVMVRRLIP